MNESAVRSRPARIAPGAQTNVPRWPAIVPPLPAGARAWVIVDLGAAPVAERWRRQPDLRATIAGVLSTPAGVGDDDLTSLAIQVVTAATVGVRVAVCGSEADVMLVRAALLAGGFLGCEVLTHATSTLEIRVRCAHCAAITRHVARPGDVVGCVACGYDEVVHHHFSRRLASYLAFRADAETKAPAERVVEVADDDG